MKKIHRYLFITATILSAFLTLVTSTDPIIKILENTIFEPIFVNELSGNTIIFNLSIGFLVSFIFYVIVVFLPEKKKKKDLAPEIERNIEIVISRINSIVRDIHRNSGNSFDITNFTKEDFRIACMKINPKNIKSNFHGQNMEIFEDDFGYKCFNNWNIALGKIDEIMRYLPFIDTELVKKLNEIRNSEFSLTYNELKNIKKMRNDDLEPWALAIYETYQKSNHLNVFIRKKRNKLRK